MVNFDMRFPKIFVSTCSDLSNHENNCFFVIFKLLFWIICSCSNCPKYMENFDYGSILVDSGTIVQWLGHVGLLHIQFCTCVNHLPWASIDNDTRTRMVEIQTQVSGTHLGLTGVGARVTYLWVQKRFVLAKQLIHFKPSLLVDLSDN